MKKKKFENKTRWQEAKETKEKKFNNKEERGENDLCLKTDGFCLRLIRIIRWIELEEFSHLAMAKKRNKTKKNNERNSSIEETKWEREKKKYR